MSNLIVIGGGPAGLAAAISAAGTGERVTLLEKNDQCGVKLLATGGGHCNLTNLLPDEEWPARFGRRGRFIVPAMRRLPLDKLRAWMEELGAPLHAPDGFHLFPVANSAKTVRNALVAEAERLGVTFRTGCRAEALHLVRDAVVGVRVNGETLSCDRVVLTTGGRSLPSSGSAGEGQLMAVGVGHKVTPLYPALVGLRAENLSSELAGLTLPTAETFFPVKGKGVLSGAAPGGSELLLTHEGLSGPAVLDISGSIAEALGESDSKPPQQPVALIVRWQSGRDPKYWQEQLANWRKDRGSVLVAALLGIDFPRRFARWLCKQAGLPDSATPGLLTTAVRDRLSVLLGAYPVRVNATEGWDKAMLTRGGVELSQINPNTLESTLVHHLHFAGEIIDLDGPCGGYNLHWCLAGGMLAGAPSSSATA